MKTITITTQLADALRVFLECYESTRDHGGGWPKYVPDNARDALAAYDAQQAQPLTPERIARALDYAHNDPDDKPAPAGDHTPEPWAAYDLDGSTPYIGNKAANGRPGWDHETIADLFRDMDDGTSVVGAMDEPYPNAAANARRIVACVNACAGIPTEALERDTVREIIRNVYEA